jgi:hypothetical protein
VASGQVQYGLSRVTVAGSFADGIAKKSALKRRKVLLRLFVSTADKKFFYCVKYLFYDKIWVA